ncbi:MAG: CdaR family transcriptional regulator, partial [Acidimicrobiia bacterium]
MSASRPAGDSGLALDEMGLAGTNGNGSGGPVDDELLVREQASNLRSLIVLSTLMTESGNESQIIHLMATSVSSFADCRLEGVYLHTGAEAGIMPVGAAWSHAVNLPEPARPEVERNLGRLAGVGGEIPIPGTGWAFAFPLRSLAGHHGFLVVSAPAAPTRRQSFLLGVLAQQTGVAVANARLLSELRSTSEELSSANTALTRTVSELQRSLEIHDRLTHAAAAGLGREGLAQTLHQLTRFPVAIEDRWGNLRAWAGSDAPDPYPKDPPHVRDQLIRRLQREGAPYRERGRLIGLASPRPDATGVIALVDPEHRAGPFELMALEHATTVLAVELARLHSLGEAELRLRRDLVDELLAGTDDESALGRAQALGHDLECPHRVVIVVGVGRTRDEDQFLHAVRTAARHFQMGSLIVGRSGTVVVLADRDPGWEEFRQAIMREVGGARCQLAVGG